MFRKFFLASSFIALGAFVIAADAHAQSIGLPPASNGSSVRTLPTPHTVGPSVQTQTYTVPGSTRPNALGGPRPQSDFGLQGPYLGLKWVGNQ